MKKTSVVIVSPALAAANNGNWQTAWRWQRMVAPRHPTRIVGHWPDGPQAAQDGLMLALHARRSAPAIAAWAQAHPDRGLAVVLTGTDLYRDIETDPAAQQSLRLAQRLVVLQELGPQALAAHLHGKTRVIFQSTTARQTLAKTPQHLRALMVGHLREEKSPQTLFQAARCLQAAWQPGQAPIFIDHIGAALDPALGQQAQATAAACQAQPAYRWLGGLPRPIVRQRIQRAHVLVHASAMEGGAHVIMEAVCSGTPVIASRVPGNVGMLGADYAGYFEHGDAAALAQLLRRCADPTDPLLARLRSQCGQRAGLFAPALEQAQLLRLIDELQETP